MRKLINASLVLIFSMSFFTVQSMAREVPLFGGNLDVNLLVDGTAMSLKDSADSIYLGTLDGRRHLGVGAETSLFYPLYGGLKAGPHFIFDYNTADSSWHSFSIFQTSLGGIVDFKIDNSSSVSAFLDYNLGWFSAEQTISTNPGPPNPAGSFGGGMPGFIFGLKTRTNFSDSIGVGVYYNLGILSLTGIKYKNSSGNNEWMNADINFSQAGVTIYF